MPNARIEKIHFSPRYFKSFFRLPAPIQKLAIKKDPWFRTNPFDGRLRTHKLKGDLAGTWSYSINREYRVLFRFISDVEVLYYDIGTHEVYR